MNVAASLRSDGSLLDQPGYDPTTHLYFAPDPRLSLPPLSEQPTQDEAKKALALLKSLLLEFKFAKSIPSPGAGHSWHLTQRAVPCRSPGYS